ncbi:MAG: ankyrin repeat domain-containing protein [Proteobacteria bacterium]|nr:ankyrin repeat domain-containing protein [Pseudomonadota bacterium]
MSFDSVLREELEPRRGPARIVEHASLDPERHARIGTVDVYLTTQECQVGRTCVPVTPPRPAPQELAEAGGEHGGDAVVLGPQDIEIWQVVNGPRCRSRAFDPSVVGHQSCNEMGLAHLGHLVLAWSSADLYRDDPPLARNLLLAKAVRSRDRRRVDTLIQSGADPNWAGADETNALCIASEAGDLGMVRYLMARGAMPQSGRPYTRTAMGCAAARDHTDLMRFFYNQGADPRWLVEPEAFDNGSANALRLLLKWVPDEIRSDGAIPMYRLYEACEAGHVELVKLLLKDGLDPLDFSVTHGSPLYTAAEYGHTEIVELLLARGDTPHRSSDKEIYRGTGFGGAAAGGQDHIVELFLRRGAPVDPVNPNTLAPLYFAAGGGHIKLMQRLLAAGADLHRQARGQDALLNAAINGKPQAVQFLLSQGARVSKSHIRAVKERLGDPVWIAEQPAYPAVLELLKAAR